MNFFLYVFLIIFINYSIIFSQSENLISDYEENSLNLNFNIGYTGFELAKVNENFTDIVNFYKDLGFPLEIQRQNPGNLLFDICVNRKISNKIWLGLGLQYTWTRSFSLYGDELGKLDIISRAHVIKSDFNIKVLLSRDEKETFLYFMELNAGFIFFDYNLKTTVEQYNDSNAKSFNYSEFLFSPVVPHIGVFFNLSYNINPIFINGKFGYRFSKISEIEAESRLNGKKYANGKTQFEVNLSGLETSIGIGFQL